MSSRSICSTLRSLGCQRAPASSSFALRLHRQFSSTTPNAIRAVFTETDNPDLNNDLRSIQEKIILPAHLPEKQRKIIFDPNKRTFLEQNPIVIEVDGLEHKFSSIDRFNDIENSKKLFMKALSNMHTADDWANLGTLLAGYKKAGIRLKANHWGKVVRLAGTSGQVYTIIECAKQSDKTGLFLNNPESLALVLASINNKISNSPGKAAEAKQALTWVEIVLDLLQLPEHAIASQGSRERLHFSRLVRGMVLFARSSVANVGTRAEKDLDSLRDEVALLTSLWKDTVGENLAEAPEFARLNPMVERNANLNKNRIPRALNGSTYVRVLAQNIKGIEIAQQLVGQEAEGLTPAMKTLSSHLHEFATKSESRTEGWADAYEKVMGRKADWPAADKKISDA